MGLSRLRSGGAANKLLPRRVTRPTTSNAPFLPLSSKSPFSTLTQSPFLSSSTSRIRRTTHDASSMRFGLRAFGTFVPDVPDPLVAENERKRYEHRGTLESWVLTPTPNKTEDFYRKVAGDVESFLKQAFQSICHAVSECDRHPVRSTDRHISMLPKFRIARALCPLRPRP